VKTPEKLIRNCEFKFKCDKAWDDLRSIPDMPDIFRACDECNKPVYFVSNEEELAFRICRNHCVAMDPMLNSRVFEREIIKSAGKPLLGHVRFKS
jgi:hypothetical protein